MNSPKWFAALIIICLQYLSVVGIAIREDKKAISCASYHSNTRIETYVDHLQFGKAFECTGICIRGSQGLETECKDKCPRTWCRVFGEIRETTTETALKMFGHQRPNCTTVSPTGGGETYLDRHILGGPKAFPCTGICPGVADMEQECLENCPETWCRVYGPPVTEVIEISADFPWWIPVIVLSVMLILLIVVVSTICYKYRTGCICGGLVKTRGPIQQETKRPVQVEDNGPDQNLLGQTQEV